MIVQNFKPGYNFFGNIFFALALIPWVNFGLNDLDSQPWSFIFSIIFLFSLKKIILPKHSIDILILIIFGLLFTTAMTNTINFNVPRAVVSYLTIPLMYIAFYNYFVRYGFPLKLFIIFNFLWIVFGILQLFIPDILDLVSKSRTSSTRGTTSLANEATDFGIYLFFSSLILIESKKFIVNNKLKILLLINFFSVLILAKSVMVIFFYILCIFFLFIHKVSNIIFYIKNSIKELRNFLILTLIIFIIVLFIKDFLTGTRVSYYINILTSSVFDLMLIFEILIKDWSINSRVESLYFSYVGSIKNYLLPGGLDSFIEMRKEIINSMQNEIFYNRYESTNIMSWSGAFIYELGLFGVISISLFFKSISRNFRGSNLYALLLFMILLSAIPVSFPMVPMLFSLIVYNEKFRNLE